MSRTIWTRASRAGALALLASLVAPGPVAAQGALEALERDGRFSVFVEAARATDVGEALAASGDARTVFAPTDEAFRRLPQALRGRLLSRGQGEALARLVALHVVPEGPYAADRLPVEMTALGGERLVATFTAGALTIRPAAPEGSADLEETLKARAANEARIVAGDIEIANGLAHGIDTVLLPPGLDLEGTGPAGRAADARLRDERSPEGREPALRAARSEPVAPAATDDDDFAAAIAAADADREDGSLVPETDRPFTGGETVRADGDRPLRLSADQMTVITLGEGEELPPGLEDAGEIVTLPRVARDDLVARLDADEGTARRSTVADRGTAEADPAADPDERDGPAVAAAAAGEDTKAGRESGDARELDLARPTISVADLIGRTVRDDGGEALGEVEDVLLSLATGEAEEVVVELDGGFLGLFGETTTVAASAISIDPLDGTVVVPRAALNLEGE